MLGDALKDKNIEIAINATGELFNKIMCTMLISDHSELVVDDFDYSYVCDGGDKYMIFPIDIRELARKLKM